MRINEISDQIPGASIPKQDGLLSTRIENLKKARATAKDLNKRPKKRLKVPYSPIRAMRYFCINCCGGSSQAITYCADIGCSLWYYRLGKRPIAGDELMDTKNFIEGGKLWTKVCGDE